MERRLTKEEVVTIEVLAERQMSNRAIARQLGIDEAAVRYRLSKKNHPRPDGRADKAHAADPLAEVIRAWHDQPARRDRPVNVRDLFEHLAADHAYEGSYKSVLRFVRAHYPAPKVRTYRRVETPPGAQSQSDWGEFPRVDIGDGPQPLHAFVMVLSHSRKPAVVWSRDEKTLGWLTAHNEAYKRLGGIAAVNRVDNCKTAIASGAGAWGVINPAYKAYADQLGFHIDACPPHAGNAKGKVESKVRLARLRIDPRGRRFEGLEGLQDHTDTTLDAWTRTAICPITGTTVYDAWQAELEHLARLPEMPSPFDVAVTRTVRADCTVSFEGRVYAVPFAFARRQVEVRGCQETVQIVAEGRVQREYPRRTAARICLDPTCYDGEATDNVLPPPPLGRMSARLQAIYEMPVERRPIDLYAALAEVAR